MVQLTVSLAPERVEALKEAAEQKGISVDEIVDAALSRAGIGSTRLAEILELARRNALLSDDDATALALEEVRQHRLERARLAAEH